MLARLFVVDQLVLSHVKDRKSQRSRQVRNLLQSVWLTEGRETDHVMKNRATSTQVILLAWRPVSVLVFRLVSLLRKNLPRSLSILFVFAFFFFNNSLYWDLASSISASVRIGPGTALVERESSRARRQPARAPTAGRDALFSRHLISWERTVQAGSSREHSDRWHAQFSVTPCHP